MGRQEQKESGSLGLKCPGEALAQEPRMRLPKSTLHKFIDLVQMFSIRRANGDVLMEEEALMYLELCDVIRCHAKPGGSTGKS